MLNKKLKAKKNCKTRLKGTHNEPKYFTIIFHINFIGLR